MTQPHERAVWVTKSRRRGRRRGRWRRLLPAGLLRLRGQLLLMRAAALLVFVLSTAGALLGAPADAPQMRTITVKLPAEGGRPVDLTGTVTLRALMGPPRTISVPAASSSKPLTFGVPARTMWETSVIVRGWWASPVVAVVQESDLEMSIALVPTGVIAGRLSTPQGAPVPKGLSVKIDVPPGSTKLPGPPSSESPCSVTDDGLFSCEVPAGVLDLSLHAPGYVAVYRWGARIAKDTRTDFGTLSLSSGSAVTGFVRLSQGKLEAGKGRVALFQPAIGTNATAYRVTRPVSEAAVAGNGFFQLPDVPPGRYVLQATYPGYAPQAADSVQVYAHVEAKIRRPIELQPPIALTLSIDPPVDFSGHPWRIELLRASTSAPGKYDGPLFQGEVKGGTVTLKDQPSGRYRVEIADANDNAFASEEFVTGSSASESHIVKIGAVAVAGTLRRGDQPLEAAIWFGGPFGDRHVRLHSNAQGEFRGILPHDGRWRVLVENDGLSTELHADVAKRDDEEQARVDLTIPANHIGGVVVDSAGASYNSTRVYCSSAGSSQHLQTDGSGRFSFDGVTAGEFTLEADVELRGGIKTSDLYTGTVGSADSLDNITLKLKDGRSIHGRVLSIDGPVIGANVKLRPGSGLEFAPASEATTGGDGVFDVNVAPGFDRAEIVVSAPGYALRVFDIAVDGRAATLNVPQAGGTLQFEGPKDANGLFFFQDDRYLAYPDLVYWMRAHGDGFPTSTSFAISDLAPGRYRVCTLKPDATRKTDLTRCVEGFLAPYGELHLAIQ
jgi:hypothetical protein